MHDTDDLAARLAREGTEQTLVHQRDRARASLAAVMRNRHADSSVACGLRRLLAGETRKAIPVTELRALLGEAS